MPKVAATLASLLLIASSIGVNIARYPLVGRTIEPAAPAAVNSAPASMQPAANESIATASEEKTEAEAMGEEHPRPSPGELAEPEHRTPAQVSEETATAQPAKPLVVAEPDTAVPIVDVRPMVPVASLQPGSGETTGELEVKRLPPVTASEPSAEEEAFAASAVYPTTSTP